MLWLLTLALAVAAPFSRVVEDGDAVALELASRSYTHEDGSQVQLVGVAHIGLSSFYDSVDAQLARADTVLYEGVGGGVSAIDGEHVGLNAAYARMASGLDLVFQLDALDYAAENWVNSDLTVDELRAAAGAEEGGRMAELLRGGREVRRMEKLAARAEKSGLVRLMARLMLIESLPRAEGQLDHAMGAPIYDALVVSRNQRVYDDLQARRGETVAVLYGAAHLRDLEERLLADGFVSAADTWTPVIDVRPGDGQTSRRIRAVRAKVVAKLDRAYL